MSNSVPPQHLLPPPKHHSHTNSHHHKKSWLEKEVSTQTFIITMSTLLIFGLVYLGIFYWITEGTTVSLGRSPQYIADITQPITKAPVSFTLQIDGPDTNSYVTEPEVLISGKTTNQSVVILSSENSDQAIPVNADGTFSTTYTLDLGANIVTIQAFDPNGNTKTETLTLYYGKDDLP